jgi:hypothetical protein
MGLFSFLFGDGRPHADRPQRKRRLGFWAARDHYLTMSTAYRGALILGDDRTNKITKASHDAFGDGVSGEPDELLPDAEITETADRDLQRERDNAIARERARRMGVKD